MPTGMVSHELQTHFGLLLKCIEASFIAMYLELGDHL